MGREVGPRVTALPSVPVEAGLSSSIDYALGLCRRNSGPLSLFRGNRLRFGHRGHEGNQSVPYSLLYRIFRLSVKGHAVDDGLDNNAIPHEVTNGVRDIPIIASSRSIQRAKMSPLRAGISAIETAEACVSPHLLQSSSSAGHASGTIRYRLAVMPLPELSKGRKLQSGCVRPAGSRRRGFIMARQSTFGYQRTVAAISLIVGPLIMSIGDLLHPQESLDAAEQAAVIIQQASRWYAAHLFLFLGMLAFIPGFLVLAGLTASRKPWAGYAARILVLIGVASFTPIFVTEMYIGRLVLNGASAAQTAVLLETFESPWILGALLIGLIAFFVGIALFAFPLIVSEGQYRWPAIIVVVAAIFLIIEIVSAQVLSSQIANILFLVGGVAFAWRLLRANDLPVEGPADA
jgi:hypothetical protein